MENSIPFRIFSIPFELFQFPLDGVVTRGCPLALLYRMEAELAAVSIAEKSSHKLRKFVKGRFG